MRFRKVVLGVLCAVLAAGAVPAPSALGRAARQQSQLSHMQRLEVLRSRLETMRRTLNSAIAGLNAKDAGADATGDDPRLRLGGLEKEAGSLLSEVNDLHSKQQKAERYDTTDIDRLETALTDLDTRVQVAMRDTARDRRTNPAAAAAAKPEKKKKGFFGRILGRGGNDEKYDELVGTVAPGRDRELFEEATKEARDDNYETARSLFGVVINTYPDSVYLPLAKLAIADTFYLEGTTSALIQAGQAYQDWVTFFPTHPLADDVMLKMAEVEMRRMGLPDREMGPARKAEQRLKAFMQQFPNSSLRPDVEVRLDEVQENLAMHNLFVGNHYYEKFYRKAANNLKGAQSRYREIVEKYPHFSRMAEVLFRLGTTYMEEEEPDEAAKYFQQLVRTRPNSDFTDKAKERLATIGAQVPETAKDAVLEEPEGLGFFGGLMQEISGVVPKTVNKDGVIISQSSKGNDIIADVIANGGTLPANYNTNPIRRTAPARDVRPLPPASQPKPKPAGDKVSAEPTRPGPPASGSDPTRAPATQPTTPATAPPAGSAKP
ncbi:MAG TPA: outer membrane protein assembly factor BamD [Pyrinomonadaceae bacterium]|nr:outer membrane protein assembly factor BamD [Pyrinomonadaceae bacterium]